MHDMPKEGCRDEVEMHVVLRQCLWILYPDTFFDTRERFERMSGTDQEIEKRASPRAIDGSALLE
jgi:hypothetical protein